jgi:hypothetical protein
MMKMIAIVVMVAASVLLVGGVASAVNVYLMSGGDTTTDIAAKAALESYGHVVTLGVGYWLFDGTQDLTGVDVVYLQANSYWTAGNMPAAGQAALLGYINGGGGLVTCEWVLWCTAAYGWFGTLQVAFPGEPTMTYRYTSPATFTEVVHDPVLSAGLPVQFTFPVDSYSGTETYMEARLGATVFYTSDYAEGAVGWAYGGGGGRVLSFSTTNGPNQVADPNFGLLFSNSMDWAAAVPEPGLVGLIGLGLAGLIALRRRS